MKKSIKTLVIGDTMIMGSDFKLATREVAGNPEPEKHMPINSAIRTGALCLLLVATAAFTQQHPEGRPAQPARPAPAKPAPPARQSSYGGVYHGGVRPNGRTINGVHHSGVPQNATQVHAGFVQTRTTSWQTEHRTWEQRGGYHGFHIPDARFHSYFGPGHYFTVGRLPLRFVGGEPCFQYDGYWVTLVDPWPADWPATWYDNDDVYIDYADGGYYLYDRAHPGIAIAVNISI